MRTLPLRRLLVSAGLAAVLAASCSSGGESATSTTSAAATTVTAAPTTSTGPGTQTAPTEPAPTGSEPTTALPAGSPLEGLEELPQLQAHLPGLADLDVHVEADDRGTRVIVFSEHGRARYKSVLVKNPHRLKILDLQGGPPIYEGTG